MLTLILSSYLLEISNDDEQPIRIDWVSILIGCSSLSQEYCKMIALYRKLMRTQLWILSCPICMKHLLPVMASFCEVYTSMLIDPILWRNSIAVFFSFSSSFLLGDRSISLREYSPESSFLVYLYCEWKWQFTEHGRFLHDIGCIWYMIICWKDRGIKFRPARVKFAPFCY